MKAKKYIEVAGAGPAGLVAAINLAKAGYSVTVYEERQEVGQRFSGDFQGIENWSTVEDATLFFERLGVKDINFICRPYYSIMVLDTYRNKKIIASKRPFFYLVKRGNSPGCLDYGLKEKAIEAGAIIVFNKRVELFSGGGIVGVGPRAADAIAKGVIFKTSMEDMAVAILDDRLAPKGYAYLLVNKGEATMATCMFRDFKKERVCFELTVEMFREVFPGLDMKDKREFGGYGNFFFGKTVLENNRYYVGEAAGLQDCLFGFGMRHAFASGYLAAKSIIDGSDYRALLKKELLPMQRTSLVNRFIFERLGNDGYARVINGLDGTNAIEWMRKQYSTSFFKRCIYPLAGWSYRSRMVDKGCHTSDCKCVWCECKGKIA